MRCDCEYIVHLVQQIMIPVVKVTQKFDVILTVHRR